MNIYHHKTFLKSSKDGIIICGQMGLAFSKCFPLSTSPYYLKVLKTAYIQSKSCPRELISKNLLLKYSTECKTHVMLTVANFINVSQTALLISMALLDLP